MITLNQEWWAARQAELSAAEEAIYTDASLAESLAAALRGHTEPPHPHDHAARLAQLRLRADVVLCICGAMRGDSEATLREAAGLLDEAKRLGERDAEARLHNVLGVSYDQLGLFERSLAAYAACLKLRRDQGDPYAIARVLGNIGVVLAREQDHEGALARYEEALALGEAHGFTSRLARHQFNALISLRALGRLDEAEDMASVAEASAIEAGHELTLPYIYLQVASLSRARGDLPRAMERVNEALERATRAELGAPMLDGALLRARLLLALGAADEALAGVEATLSTPPRTQDPILLNMRHQVHAECLEARGELSGALAATREHQALEERRLRGLVERQRAGLRIAFEVDVLRAEKAALSQEREAMALANRRLRTLNRELEDLMAIASHDLRAPLSTAKLILETFDPGEPEAKIMDRVARLSRACDRTLDVVNLLLQSHSVDQDADPYCLTEVSLRDRARSAVSIARPRAEAKRIQLQLHAEGPARVLGDSTAVDQILDNLISNAVKFSPTDSRVDVSLRRVGPRVRLEVQDQGPGLSGEDLRRVFRKYARLSARPTGGESSLGLGLFIVKRLVTRLGGRARAKNAPSGGACFYVELPAVEEPS